MILPAEYSAKRSSLGFDNIPCGFGGIYLFSLSEVQDGKDDGRHVVIGRENACGDSIYFSVTAPYAVFTSVDGSPSPVAPSLAAFWSCLDAFRSFANDRGTPTDMEAHLPDEDEIESFLDEIERFCAGDEEAIYFWALVTEIEPSEDEEEDERE